MGRVERMFGLRRLTVGAALCSCLVTAAPPVSAQQDSAPQFLAQSVSPQSGYYGACGDQMPIGVTIRADLTSPLSLAVTLSYRYVSVDPQIPPSPLLQARMPLLAAGTYAAAIDISDQAPAYLKGGDGSLQYRIEAKDPNGDLVQSRPGSVGIRHCPNPNSVAAQSTTVTADR
jgi:hypothetical protein